MRKSFRLSSALLVSIASALALGELLLTSGLCFEKGSWLSDDVRLRIALGYEIFHDPSIPNEAARKYLAEHEGCCAVEPHFPETSSLFDRLFGFANTWVRVTHEASDEQRSYTPRDGDYYMALIGITRCGDVFKTTGIRVDAMR